MNPPNYLNLLGQLDVAHERMLLGQAHPQIANIGQDFTLGRLVGGRERSHAVCRLLPWVYLRHFCASHLAAPQSRPHDVSFRPNECWGEQKKFTLARVPISLKNRS